VANEDLVNRPLWLRWWPGLPELWQRGDRTALTLAIGFAVALNVSIASYGIWPDVLPESVRIVWTLSIAIIWGLSLSKVKIHVTTSSSDAEKEEDQGLFIKAQEEYLKGHWYEAESLLTQRLGGNPNDDAARLLLVSVYRRASQPSKAFEQLDEIRSTQDWQWEMKQERQQIERSQQRPTDDVLQNSHEFGDNTAGRPNRAA